jgi:hypothetical protein
MSITKLKWQWQSSHNDLAHVTSQSRPQTGRVITGMLTGGSDPLQPQANHTITRTSGGSNRNTF